MKSVVLVTGAGSGIGKLSAQSLAQAGHIVYATMRDIEGRNKPRADAMREWASQDNAELHPLELDVLSQESADAAVAAIVGEQGRLDVVIHNAGHLVIGPTEAFTPEELIKVYDTNLFGALRVNRAVLPQMRGQEPASCCGSAARPPRAGFPPFMGPTVRPRPRWIRWPSPCPTSSPLRHRDLDRGAGAFTRGTDHFPTAGKPADRPPWRPTIATMA